MDSNGRPDTLEEIEALEKNTLCPADVAPFLKVSQYSINCASKAGTLPWAYQMGTKTIIPKDAFVYCHKYGTPRLNIAAGL